MTEQEKFWAGDFGDDYTVRNSWKCNLKSRTALFAEILGRTSEVERILELGAGAGQNLKAINGLLSSLRMTGVEINAKAYNQLKRVENVTAVHCSVFGLPELDNDYDLVFTCGVLIHIAPEKLDSVYEYIFNASRKYILLIEYYNPTPVEVTYRGNEGKLFKRDFAGDMLKKFKKLELMSYGFKYHGDNNFPADDVTWFLMRKR